MAALSHLAAVALLFAVGPLLGLGWSYFAGCLLVAALLAWSHVDIARRGLARVGMRFMTANGVVGLVYGVVAIVAVLLKYERLSGSVGCGGAGGSGSRFATQSNRDPRPAAAGLAHAQSSPSTPGPASADGHAGRTRMALDRGARVGTNSRWRSRTAAPGACGRLWAPELATRSSKGASS